MVEKYKKNLEKEKPEFDSLSLDISRVTRVAAGGKRFRFRAVVIAGNRNGKVGVGVEKGADVAKAVEKATREAKKNMIEVFIADGTIPYSVWGKHSAAKVLMRPQRKGKGIVAGGAMRAICDLAGIRDISGKILSRTSNKLNIARATIEALKKLKAPAVSEQSKTNEHESETNQRESQINTNAVNS